MKHKKGYIQDVAFLAVFVLVLVVVIMFSGILNTQLVDRVQNHTTSETALSISEDLQGRYNTIFDWIFVMVFILLGLAIIVSMFLLDTHPALFFIVMIVFAFLLIAVAILGNAYDSFTSTDALSEQAGNLTVTDWLMDHFVIVLVVFGFLGVVVLFAKIRVGMFR